ncbi:unnamed protein product [Schistocephalus solidus]|uniref:Uncharacterized protein n=1 Tax=Schistocephalus solidus TaxID=70667 RepID=A0A183TFB0_SCHSO|nr:unnamed protein product [Schistocephalus solidus]
MNLFAAGCADFGFTISTTKTVVMHHPPPSAEYIAPESMSTMLNSNSSIWSLHWSRTGGKCSCGRLLLVPNSHLVLLEVGLFPAATPRATVTTGGLNQVRVSSVVCASTTGNGDELQCRGWEGATVSSDACLPRTA